MCLQNAEKENIIHIVFAILGLASGFALGREGGWFYGMLGGFALGLYLKMSNQVFQLEKELSTLKSRLDGDPQPEPSSEQESLEVTSPESSVELASEEIELEPAVPSMALEMPEVEKVVATQHRTIDDESLAKQPEAEHEDIPLNEWNKKSSSEPLLPIENATKWIKDFFTTGNVVVKVGVAVLFFGIAFLVKYAAERDIVPIELRLAGIALAAVGMLIFGWRLRLKKPGYALVIQGGALGVLYITIFASLRLYDLLPATLAFTILFIFAVLTAVLAVLQNSRSLAILGLSGGFLAPILTSTGSGNYVALFSYYLVLNLGIFGIAWFRSWRLLNLLGFLFTFSVATAWGVKNYLPEDFSTTEPFLIAFFLLYVAISILFAFRQPIKLKGYVDSTLVFGVPLVGFGLQAGMVYHIEYALAWSSLALAVFYIGLASFLWRRMAPESRLICEAFLALGVMFATLTVPFALDAQWTAATWVLEGAAAVWVGSRQARLLPRLLGYVLQLAGGIAYLTALSEPSSSQIFILNGKYLGALIVSLSGIFVAWQLSSDRAAARSSEIGNSRLMQWESGISIPFLVWGLMWWLGAGAHEIVDKIETTYAPLGGILFLSFTAVTAQWFKQNLSWSALGVPALVLLPAMYLMLPFLLFINGHPFADWNLLSWFVALTAFYWILKKQDEQLTFSLRALHIAGFWFIVLLLTIESAWQVDRVVDGADTWWIITAGLLPTVMMVLMYRYGQLIAWPVAGHQKVYQLTAILPMCIAIWASFILMNMNCDGNVAPIKYLPVLNPLDMVLAFQMLALIYWQRVPLSIEDWGERRWRFDKSQLLLALSIFLWLNTMWLRLAHHAWSIDFDISDMTQSRVVQAGIAILWGVTGLSCMIFGARKQARHIWIAGAFVMAAVVVKLFLFDLANTGTVERIVSFMSVGILLLIVGYFAPVPPSDSKQYADEK